MKKVLIIVVIILVIANAVTGVMLYRAGDTADKLNNLRLFNSETELVSWVDDNAERIMVMPDVIGLDFNTNLIVQKEAAKDGYLIAYSCYDWYAPESETWYDTEVLLAYTSDGGRYYLPITGDYFGITRINGVINQMDWIDIFKVEKNGDRYIGVEGEWVKQFDVGVSR